MKDLEIPLGKRSKKYRFFEILPAALSYLLVVAPFILSAIAPIFGVVYLLVLVTTLLVKALGIAVRTSQGYNVLKRATKVDWGKRLLDVERAIDGVVKKGAADEYGAEAHLDNLNKIAAQPEDFPRPSEVCHAIIIPSYNEAYETLVGTIEAIVKTTYDKKRVYFVLSNEERGDREEEEKVAERLKKKFGKVFKEFFVFEHPDGLPNEVVGKGANITFAGRELAKILKERGVDVSKIIVTSMDSDNKMSECYLDYVAYEFAVHTERKRLAFQPISLFMNNIWDVPAPMRIIATGNSFWNIICSMRPHALRNFAAHSQPMDALVGMDFWSKRTIVEDGHQYWRSLFYFKGDYRVLPIFAPIYQDAVLSDTLFKTLKAQFIQLRRWDYGASDVAYVGDRLFSDKKKRRMKFFKLFPKFVRLLDGHVTLAAMAPMIAISGWIPFIVNHSSKNMLVYNFPNIIGAMQTVASIGLLVTVLFSMKMLPPRPAKYKKHRSVWMVVQWIMMPVVSIFYNSFTAFYSQTRLMAGKYMEKFDVTEKVVKK
jgi:cellulose synthase/poly-beta-1,6-N-acetylglucosamine synthase-like glycosyltransferase